MENTLGMIIKTARINAGLSQLALADLCDLSISQIKNIERGIAKRPHLSTLKKLANVLNLDLKKLNYSYNSSNDVSEKNLSTIIYMARINAGLSQAELANLCDLSTLQISNIERGIAKRPYPFTLKKLANVLNLDLKKLNYSYTSSNDVSEKNLSTIIYVARINAGLSQEELTKLCQSCHGLINNIEQGKTKRPHLSTLENLASVLNLNLQELKQICGYP